MPPLETTLILFTYSEALKNYIYYESEKKIPLDINITHFEG